VASQRAAQGPVASGHAGEAAEVTAEAGVEAVRQVADPGEAGAERALEPIRCIRFGRNLPTYFHKHEYLVYSR
jgi:hypothetical protein